MPYASSKMSQTLASVGCTGPIAGVFPYQTADTGTFSSIRFVRFIARALGDCGLGNYRSPATRPLPLRRAGYFPY